MKLTNTLRYRIASAYARHHTDVERKRVAAREDALGLRLIHKANPQRLLDAVASVRGQKIPRGEYVWVTTEVGGSRESERLTLKQAQPMVYGVSQQLQIRVHRVPDIRDLRELSDLKKALGDRYWQLRKDAITLLRSVTTVERLCKVHLPLGRFAQQVAGGLDPDPSVIAALVERLP